MKKRLILELFVIFICLNLCFTASAGYKVATGTFPDIAIDSQGNVHIVYASGGKLWYRKYDVGADRWTQEQNTGIDQLNSYRNDPDIVVDSQNRPHVIGGVDDQDGRVEGGKYAYFDGSSWVQIDARLSRDTKLAIDSSDNIYIVDRRGNSGGNIGLVRRNAGAGSFTNMPDPEVVGGGLTGTNDHVYGDIAIGPTDNDIHIVFRQPRANPNASYKTVEYMYSNNGGSSYGNSRLARWPGDPHPRTAEGPHIVVSSTGTVIVTGADGYIFRKRGGSWPREGAQVTCPDRGQPELSAGTDGLVYLSCFGGFYNIRDSSGNWLGEMTVPGAKPVGFMETAGANGYAYAVWEEGNLVSNHNDGQYDGFDIVFARIDADGTISTVGTPPEVGGGAEDPAALQGQIIVDPNYPRWLKYKGGGPFFMCGPGDPEGFLYRGTRQPEGTRAGDQMHMINRLMNNGGNAIYLMAIRTHGGDADWDNTNYPDLYPDALHNPFENGDLNGNLDDDILDQWEEWFTLMDNNGIVIYFIFYDDNVDVAQNLGWPLDASNNLHPQERYFIETVVNRFEHHKNLIWCVMEEVQEMGTDYRQHASRIADTIRQADDYNHIIAVHQLSGLTFEFAGNPNIEQFGIQFNPWQEPAGTELYRAKPANRGDPLQAPDVFHQAMVRAWNNAAGRYNLNMAEVAHGHVGTGNPGRRNIWAMAMGGAYVMVNGWFGWYIDDTPLSNLNECGYMIDFFESTNFNEMEPNDGLAFGDSQYVLAKPGESYIAYGLNVNTVGLRGITAGTYNFKWLDTVSGSINEQNDVNVAAGDQTWSKPPGFGNEVVVYVQNTETQPPPGPPPGPVSTATTISVESARILVNNARTFVKGKTEPSMSAVDFSYLKSNDYDLVVLSVQNNAEFNSIGEIQAFTALADQNTMGVLFIFDIDQDPSLETILSRYSEVFQDYGNVILGVKYSNPDALNSFFSNFRLPAIVTTSSDAPNYVNVLDRVGIVIVHLPQSMEKEEMIQEIKDVQNYVSPKNPNAATLPYFYRDYEISLGSLLRKILTVLSSFQ